MVKVDGMKRIKKINILSLGYLQGAIGAGIGLIFGTLITLLSLLVSGIGGTMHADMGWNTSFNPAVFSIGAIIFLPLLYGVAGFVSGVITAVVYNLAARFTGGITVEIEDEIRK